MAIRVRINEKEYTEEEIQFLHFTESQRMGVLDSIKEVKEAIKFRNFYNDEMVIENIHFSVYWLDEGDIPTVHLLTVDKGGGVYSKNEEEPILYSLTTLYYSFPFLSLSTQFTKEMGGEITYMWRENENK